LGKDADGNAVILELDNKDDPRFAPFAALLGDRMALLTPEDLEHVAAELPANTSGMVLLFEHRWAEHIKEAMAAAGGFLVSGPGESLIRLDLEFHSPDALGEMIVRYAEGAPVRLRDIGTVEDGLADDRQIVRFNGTPTVGIGLVKVSNYNTVKLVDDVRERLDTQIIPQLPAGLTLKVSIDDSNPIRKIVNALEDHLIEGTILAGLVVWFFLRSFRSTLIISTAIPVSLLGAIAVMYFLGYTFNQMSLLGLLLLIGVVVDDAIVVLENVYRRREEDPSLDRRTAAIEGTEQVGFAVIAASLTLVSIFGSVLFLEGIVARFFQSFAVVVTVGVLVSLFVSLTLTPMLCSRFLEPSEKHGVATPEGWKPGDKVIVPPPQTVAAAEKRMQEGFECTDWYFCRKVA